jgi:hypothetical protein
MSSIPIKLLDRVLDKHFTFITGDFYLLLALQSEYYARRATDTAVLPVQNGLVSAVDNGH